MSTLQISIGEAEPDHPVHMHYLSAAALLTDEELMAACAAGEKYAFDELHRRYGSYIRNFVQRKICDAGQAEDIAQEVFLRLFRSSARFDAARPFKKWLFTIASNEVRRYWSRSARTPLSLSRSALDDENSDNFEALLPDTHPIPDEVYLDSIKSEVLRKAIIELPEFQRTALIMRVYRNMSLKDIAEATHMHLATVNSRLQHATQKLRNAMRRTGYTLPVVFSLLLGGNFPVEVVL